MVQHQLCGQKSNDWTPEVAGRPDHRNGRFGQADGTGRHDLFLGQKP